jgi:hypothetical protein
MTERGRQEVGVRGAKAALTLGEESVLSEIVSGIADGHDQGDGAIQVNGLTEFAELLLRLCYPSAPEAWVKSEAEAVLAEVGEKVTAKGANFEHWVGLSEEELAIERAAYLSSLEYYAG